MPTIRIHDWTKEQLEAVREAESHSSYDSVVKALLRDWKLAQAVGEEVHRDYAEGETIATAVPEKRFDTLTALGEIESPEKGIMFLWCPNCGNEIAHIDAEGPLRLSVFETQCQQCLTELDHHAIVVVEIGYPVEEKSVDGELLNDLRACIIDYWNRTLVDIGQGSVDADVDEEYLVYQIFEYAQTFDWHWPRELATVTLVPGETYHNRATDELVTIQEALDDYQTKLGAYRASIRAADGSTEEESETTLEPETVRELLCNRDLYLTHK